MKSDSAAHADDREFLPFYEKLAGKVSRDFITGRVAISAGLGLPFLIFYYALPVFGEKNTNDWAWFLGLLVITAMLCVYYATHTFRTLVLEMNARLPKRKQLDISVLKNNLSDRNFAAAGIIFGFLNCGVGYLLGPPYSNPGIIIAILIGYFVAGFVCGMAVWGIFSVLAPIRAFSDKAKPLFDFTSPDHCAGMGFLGDALIVFSSVTLIVGVMISIYIFKTDWGNDKVRWVMLIKAFWILFPYLCSVVALLAPAIPLNTALRDYKVKEEVSLKKRLAAIRTQLENERALDKRKASREDYEFQQNRRRDLNTMRTWPFGLGAHLRYLSIFIANVYATASTGAAHWLAQSLHIVRPK